jgi:hypothetical protein
MSLALTLEKLQNGHVIERYELKGDKRRIYKVGRVPSSDIWVDDPVAARLHAIIDLSNKRAVLRDMGTPVGTTVNGQRVSRATLRSDDVIKIGDTSFHVVMNVRGLDRPPPIPSAGERKREGFLDAVATLTPHSADQLQMYAEFLRQRRKRPIVKHDDAPRDITPKGVVLGDDDEPTMLDVNDSQIVEVESAEAEAQPPPAAAPAKQRRRVHYAAMVVIGALTGVALLPFDAPKLEPSAPAASEPAPAPVPVQAAPAVERAPEPAPEPVPAAPQLPKYTVRPGDTIGSIARREMGTSTAWEKLWEHNRATLSDPSKLAVGMTLEIPAP